MSRVKRGLAAAVVSGAMLTMMAAPAFAHDAGPCGVTDQPGNSGYAQHHIVPNAKEGTLGAGGHIPGTHKGFSICIHQ